MFAPPVPVPARSATRTAREGAEPAAQRARRDAERDAAALASTGLLIQRKCACGCNPGNGDDCAPDDASAGAQAVVQRKAAGEGGSETWRDAVAAALASAGRPLDTALRESMQAHIASQLPHRVPGHAAPRAPLAAHAAGATHAAHAGQLRIGPATDAFEREADAVAAALDRFPGAGAREARSRFDFSAVRVHDDAASAASARALGALAYTVGPHLVFGASRYAPHSASGRRLIAHELTHVAQQGAAPLVLRRAPDDPHAAQPAEHHRTCRTGHTSGQGELVPEDEKGGNVDLYYRIWGTWRRGDADLKMFAERVVNAWIPWRFGPLAAEDRHKVSDFLFQTALSKIGRGVGMDGCDYAIALTRSALDKAVELSGENQRSAEVRRERKALAEGQGAMPKTEDLSVSQRLVLLEQRIDMYWTSNQDEEAILDILRHTPDDQAADLSRRLSTDRHGDETYFAALDRVVDLGNNLELHEELTKLHLRGLGKEKGVSAILDNAPVLPWHDVMGFGADTPVTFSLTAASAGKIVVKCHVGTALFGSDMPFKGEIDALPGEMRIGGKAYDADQLFKVHDWDEGKFVVVRARDLLAYQHIGVRNWLGHMATVASFALPVGTAATAAGKVALFTIERALPLLILATRENRLSLLKWFPTWGPRMIYFADIAELAIGLYGVGSFARSGAKFFNAWREARFARKLWEAGQSVPEAESAATRIESAADKVLQAESEFRQAESAGTHVGAPGADTPEGLPLKTPDADAAAAQAHGGSGTAAPHGAPPRDKVFASVPVKGGHHVEATARGLELCSPPPCPLLRVEYAAELKRNPHLNKEMDALDTLRKNNAPEAARKAAELRETLDYLRAHGALFDKLQLHGTPAQEARLARLFETAEDAGIFVGEPQLNAIVDRMRNARGPAGIERELASLERDLEIGPAVREETSGAARVGRTAGRSPAATEELGGAPRRPEVDDPDIPAPQRLHPEPSLGGNAEAARARGLPSEVVDSGYVYTRRDLSDVVPETGFSRARPARQASPLTEERVRGVAGRRPTAAPDLADVQNSTVAADLRLTEDHLAKLNRGLPPGSRWTLEDVRINRTQVAEGTTGPMRASLHTRPDMQFTIRDPEGRAQRFVIEYDRSPPTRALGHALDILERDPAAIVILKVIGFD
ncbi:eCIS core domain-containing protein [Paraburkholderia sp. J10-1]|uniref:eCIS core domain-containing protein n=1 Tax=Paraburkholderia sp. J10-1 TaxID=2805430 RepID=UPI002AB6DB5E|nr:DUF4157 domain-containing protein [Paraburkholderia sp. J10-1]